jgi:hypothetical protein
MVSTAEAKAIYAALDAIRQILEGVVAREAQEAKTAQTTGYPAGRLTRQR